MQAKEHRPAAREARPAAVAAVAAGSPAVAKEKAAAERAAMHRAEVSEVRIMTGSSTMRLRVVILRGGTLARRMITCETVSRTAYLVQAHSQITPPHSAQFVMRSDEIEKQLEIGARNLLVQGVSWTQRWTMSLAMVMFVVTPQGGHHKALELSCSDEAKVTMYIQHTHYCN